MRYRPEAFRGTIADIPGYLSRELSRIASAILNPDPVWDDVKVSLTTAKPGATKVPDFIKFRDNGAGSTGVYCYHFDKSTIEEVFFDVQLPHSFWEYHGVLKPHIHWAPVDTGTGTVRWGLEFTPASFGTAFPTTSIIYAENAGAGISRQHQIAQFTDINATDLAISSVILCRLFRDASNGNDTYNADAAAVSVDFHIEKDSSGSIAEYIKRR
jgi:hypothetical protein